MDCSVFAGKTAIHYDRVGLLRGYVQVDSKEGVNMAHCPGLGDGQRTILQCIG